MSEESSTESTGASEQATPETDPSDVMTATQNAAARQEGASGEEPKADAPPAKEGTKEGQQEGQKEAPKAGGDDNQPITDWSKVKLDIPANAPIDQPTLEAFGKVAIEMGLNAKQANQLINFQLDQLAEYKQHAYEVGTQALNEEWGGKFQENSQAVLTLIANIDRELGGSGTEFSKALDMCGATLFPAVCKGLLHIAKMTSEDSIGRGGAAAQAEHVETALEGLQNALEESKRR